MDYKELAAKKNLYERAEKIASELGDYKPFNTVQLIYMGLLMGKSERRAVEYANKVRNLAKTESIAEIRKRLHHLPVAFKGEVPSKYSGKYNSEEYLLMIYRKLGIKVIGEAGKEYDVILPKGIILPRWGNGVAMSSKGRPLFSKYVSSGSPGDYQTGVEEIYVNL